jgi:ribosomal-protein-serine acetyltransferase
VTEPLLLDVPTEITTDRLRLRVPRAGDGAIIIPTVRASLAEMKPWLPWATDAYDAAGCEAWCRGAAAKFLGRSEFHFLVFTAAGNEYVGTAGLMRFRWDVPACEIGYWLGTPHVGRGYASEAVMALTGLAMGVLSAARVEIRADAANGRSRRVAERCGYALEGTLRKWGRNVRGQLADECVYALVR